MNLVKISAYACGYYSENEYEETVYITEESYMKLKEEIDDMDMSIAELDGKHSEVEAEIEIEVLTKEEQLLEVFNNKDDGDSLYWDIRYIFRENNIDFDKEQEMVNNYIDSLDSLVKVTYTIKKSNLDKLNNFIGNLEEK